MVLTARGAEQHSHGVDNVLAFINLALALGKSRPPVQRIRHDHRAGQRARRARARAESRSAAWLSPHRRSGGAPRMSRRCGAFRNPICQAAGKSAYELLESAGEPDGIRALVRHRFESRSLGAECDACRRSARAARFSGRRRFLSLGDRGACRRRAAVGAMGGRRGHHHQSRRARHPPPARMARAAGQVRTDIDILCDLAERSASRAFFSFADRQRCLRRAARARRAAAAPTIPESPTTGSIAKTGCSGRARRATIREPRGCFTETFPTATGRARFHHSRARRPGRSTRRQFSPAI